MVVNQFIFTKFPFYFKQQKPCLSRQASQSSATPAPGSPTSRLLLEYEMHLRNTLAKGMDAESYSLHTFEALLSQSMEDLGECFHGKCVSLSIKVKHKAN